jgi:hypothetical protein
MGKTRYVQGLVAGQAISSSSTQFHPVGNGPFNPSGTSTTEANPQVIHRTAGTFSNLFIRIITNTYATTLAFQLRKNAVNGNSVATISIGGTGVFEDTTHTDAITAGDKMTYQVPTNSAAKTITITIMAVTFDATGTTAVRCLDSTFGVSTGSMNTNRYNPIIGEISYTNTTEANAKTRIRVAGTFKNLCIRLSANSITATCKSRKNGANGAMTITSSAAAGWYEDTTNTDTVAAGDDFNSTYVMSATTSTTIQHIAMDFVDATNSYGVHCNGWPELTTQNASVTNYFAMDSDGVPITTEVNTKCLAKDAYTFKELTVNITTNTITSSSTVRTRKSGVNGNVVATITASTTGVFSDSTNTDAFAATDDMNLQFVTGAGGTSLIWTFIDIFYTTVTTKNVTKTLTETMTITDSAARLSTKNRLAGSLFTYIQG